MTVLMRRLLLASFADPSLVTEPIVARFADLMDREDPTGSIRSSYAQAALLYEEERTKLLARISMPTLVMWSEFNRTLPVENGRAMTRWARLTSSLSSLKMPVTCFRWRRATCQGVSPGVSSPELMAFVDNNFPPERHGGAEAAFA